MNPSDKKQEPGGNALYLKVFTRYLLQVFMLIFVLAASGIVVWTAFSPQQEGSDDLEIDSDQLMLVRDELIGWLQTSSEEELNFSESRVITREDLPDDFPFSDLQPITGIQWLASEDKLGLQNLPGDAYQVFVSDFEGEEYHLYDGWVIWCPFEETDCYFQLVEPENRIDFETLALRVSD